MRHPQTGRRRPRARIRRAVILWGAAAGLAFACVLGTIALQAGVFPAMAFGLIFGACLKRMMQSGGRPR